MHNKIKEKKQTRFRDSIAIVDHQRSVMITVLEKEAEKSDYLSCLIVQRQSSVRREGHQYGRRCLKDSSITRRRQTKKSSTKQKSINRTFFFSFVQSKKEKEASSSATSDLRSLLCLLTLAFLCPFVYVSLPRLHLVLCTFPSLVFIQWESRL